MKSKYLAKADYLRELGRLARELYALGDFTSEAPERVKLAAKMRDMPLLEPRLKS